MTGENQAYFTEGGRNLGIHNLQSHFNQLDRKFEQQAAEGHLQNEILGTLTQPSEGREFFGELVVQRSCAYVRASEKLTSKSKVLFPDREAPRVAPYQLKITYGRLLEAVAMAFDREKPLFALAIYNPLSYLVTPNEQDFEAGRQKQVVALIRTLFLKRFESSAKAFEFSCTRLLHRLLVWYEVHATRTHDKTRLDRWKTKNSKLLEQLGHTDAVQRSLWPDDEEDDEFITDEDRAAIEQLDPDIYRIGDMLDNTHDDLVQLAEFLDLVRAVRPERDSKLTALAKLLTTDKELKDRKVIIFTEFSDTAKYLEEHLKSKGLTHIERIDGSSSQKQRSAVIHRFAPFYNHATPPAPENEIQILIATRSIRQKARRAGDLQTKSHRHLASPLFIEDQQAGIPVPPRQSDGGRFAGIQGSSFLKKRRFIWNHRNPIRHFQEQLPQFLRRTRMSRLGPDGLRNGHLAIKPTEQIQFTDLGQARQHGIIANDDHGTACRKSNELRASARISSAKCPGHAPCWDSTACASQRDPSSSSLRTCSSESNSFVYASAARASSAAWLRFWKPALSSAARSSGMFTVKVISEKPILLGTTLQIRKSHVAPLPYPAS